MVGRSPQQKIKAESKSTLPALLICTLHRSILPKGSLFDHFIGYGEQLIWHSQAERLRDFEIDDELKFGRLHDRQVGRLRPLQNPACIDPNLPKRIREARAIT